MELRSRQAAILGECLETKSGLILNTLLSKYSVTKRTFYYDIETLNEWLSELDYGELKIAEQRLYLISNREEEIKEELKNMNYYYLQNERLMMEFILISLSPNPIDSKYLQRTFEVSKNTITNDIRDLRELIEVDGFNITSTTSEGYILQGEEYAIRKKIGSFFTSFDNIYPKDEVKKIIQEILVALTGKNFDFYEIARSLIKQYEKDINSQLYTNQIDSECTMILAAWIRALKGNGIHINAEEQDTLKITKSYTSMVKNSGKLRVHGMYLPDNEVYYMTILLLGIRTTEFSSQEQETLFIYDFTDKLMDNFEKISCSKIVDKEQLGIRLRSHIRPFYYRLKYGIKENNVLTSQVKTMYPEVFDFCKRSIGLIDTSFAKLISDDELAYLTIYFIGTQDNYHNAYPEFEANNHKILIINKKGRAENNHLLFQINDLLGTNFTYDYQYIANSKLINFNKYVMILTSEHLMDISTEDAEKVIYIGDNVSDKYSEIIKVFSDQGYENKDHKLVESIIALMHSKFGERVKEDESLYLDILEIVQNEKIGFKHKFENNYFFNVMEEKKYRILRHEVMWEAVVSEGYKDIYGIENTIQILDGENKKDLQSLSLYNVTPEIVLVNASEDINISDYRVSVILSEQELAIGDENRGKMFIFFASQNNFNHFSVLMDIYRYCDTLSFSQIESLIG